MTGKNLSGAPSGSRSFLLTTFSSNQHQLLRVFVQLSLKQECSVDKQGAQQQQNSQREQRFKVFAHSWDAEKQQSSSESKVCVCVCVCVGRSIIAASTANFEATSKTMLFLLSNYNRGNLCLTQTSTNAEACSEFQIKVTPLLFIYKDVLCNDRTGRVQTCPAT